MMTTRHRLVDEYLERLEAAAQRLPIYRRIELLNDMREHIDVTLAERDSPGEAEIRELLDRLGDPGEIVTAWLPDDEPYPAQVATRPAPRRPGVPTRKLTAVLFLLLGGFAFGLGWIVGLVLLWASTVWTWRDKLLGTFVVPGGLAAILAVTLLPYLTTPASPVRTGLPSGPSPLLPSQAAGSSPWPCWPRGSRPRSTRSAGLAPWRCDGVSRDLGDLHRWRGVADASVGR